MEDSNKNAYIAGLIFSCGAVFFLMIAINTGWNLPGQFLGVFGLLSGVLGVGSIWKPDSIGQIASQIMENMQKNAEKQNRPRNTKKITTQIINVSGSGNNLNNITDSKNTKVNNSKKSSTRTKK